MQKKILVVGSLILLLVLSAGCCPKCCHKKDKPAGATPACPRPTTGGTTEGGTEVK